MKKTMKAIGRAMGIIVFFVNAWIGFYVTFGTLTLTVLEFASGFDKTRLRHRIASFFSLLELEEIETLEEDDEDFEN